MKFELCKGRHATPADDSIFGTELNPLDIEGLEQIAMDKLQSVTELDLYVTGLSVALVAVINTCHKLGIKLTLWHFDKDSNSYYPQPVA